MQRVLLGMSGGIDSSVSAILLQQQGFQVVGLTLRLWSENDPVNNLKIPEYILDAQHAAKKLDIEHIVVDVRQEFYDKVIIYFKNEYLKGKTPNPCAKCNVVLKWNVLRREADNYNCDYIATGHYVNKTEINGLHYILKGIDPDKEQSFFLWGLDQNILRRAIFPLGNKTKSEIREIALNHGFVKIERKKESTGICFLNGNYQPFLEKLIKVENTEITEGDFVDINGNFLGKHSGFPYYTVGQRRGLGLVPKEPLFVKEIIPETNRIVLANRNFLYKKQMLIKDYNLINIEDFDEEVITRIRYRKQSAKSKVTIVDSYNLRIDFVDPEWSIAPGQTAAFYNGDRLLGGGFIYQ